MNNDAAVVRVDIFVDGKMDVQHMTMVAGQLKMNDAHWVSLSGIVLVAGVQELHPPPITNTPTNTTHQHHCSLNSGSLNFLWQHLVTAFDAGPWRGWDLALARGLAFQQ